MVISLQRAPELFLGVYSVDFSDKGNNIERAAVRVPQRRVHHRTSETQQMPRIQEIGREYLYNLVGTLRDKININLV